MLKPWRQRKAAGFSSDHISKEGEGVNVEPCGEGQGVLSAERELITSEEREMELKFKAIG